MQGECYSYNVPLFFCVRYLQFQNELQTYYGPIFQQQEQILISIHNHPHYFIFSEYLLQIFVTVCRSTLVYICKLFLCLLYLILILRNLHPASLFHSVNKRLTYCQKDLVLTQWFCFRLKVIWLPSPLGGVENPQI